MAYDPWQDLRDRPHLTLSITRLPVGDAWYCHDVPGIAIDDRLNRVQRRCVLAHELAHVDLGHREQAATTCGWDLGTSRIARRQESDADQLAARRLLPVWRLAEVAACHEDRATVAEELDVTEHLLQVRLDHLHPAERGHINRRVAAKGEVA